MVNPTSSTSVQPPNGTSTPNGISKAESPATPASMSLPSKPEKAAKPSPRLPIETTVEQLSAALGEKWDEYGRELNLFIIGKRTRVELLEMLDQILGSDMVLRKLHNNLLMGILANASRDPPPLNGTFSGWNRNKKRKEPIPSRTRSSGRQKRLKTEIMGLPPSERNRIKNMKGVFELDPNERKMYPPVPGALLESRRAKFPPRLPKDKNFQPSNAVQADINKGLSVPLSSETLELPSLEDIADRARGIAYEYQLPNAIGPLVPELILAGLENHLKNLLTQIILRVRTNRPHSVNKPRSDGKPSVSSLRPAGHVDRTSITLEELGLSWDLSPYMLVENIPPPLRLWNTFTRDEGMEEEDYEPVVVPPEPDRLQEDLPVTEQLAWHRIRTDYERRALASILDEILV